MRILSIFWLFICIFALFFQYGLKFTQIEQRNYGWEILALASLPFCFSQFVLNARWKESLLSKIRITLFIVNKNLSSKRENRISKPSNLTTNQFPSFITKGTLIKNRIANRISNQVKKIELIYFPCWNWKCGNCTWHVSYFIITN